ncbi:ATP-binding protein [Candidatus Parabeggiatoa sp. HSG14]|uniref:slr1658 superfamily regulator n=1 Tax=Candidatus Parabeggiatoa sp. HSG14 TaxID=3055593 RepID=UPI0025A7F4CE|nr:ATP-binding protein [Thiotrichales bacterium HSG14]
MTQIFGNFIQELPEGEEYLTLVFSPRSFHYKFWRQNKMSADFVADYFKTFFISKEDKEEKKNTIKTKNLQYAVKYIANELLENAMKFQDRTCSLAAYLKLSLFKDKVVFHVTHSINAQQEEILQTFIKQLINEDPDALYIKTITAKAKENDNSRSSGLGLLSMMHLYSAQVGWKFERLQTNPPITTVNTMVCLNT